MRSLFVCVLIVVGEDGIGLVLVFLLGDTALTSVLGDNALWSIGVGRPLLGLLHYLRLLETGLCLLLVREWFELFVKRYGLPLVLLVRGCSVVACRVPGNFRVVCLLLNGPT